MCRVSFSYSTELSVSVSVPQPPRLTEKSSSRSVLLVFTGTGVSVGSGMGVSVGITTVAVGTEVLVGPANTASPCLFRARKANPATESKRQAPAKQPIAQPSDGPAFAAALGVV